LTDIPALRLAVVALVLAAAPVAAAGEAAAEAGGVLSVVAAGAVAGGVAPAAAPEGELAAVWGVAAKPRNGTAQIAAAAARRRGSLGIGVTFLMAPPASPQQL
jgi:hypothetical protein